MKYSVAQATSTASRTCTARRRLALSNDAWNSMLCACGHTTPGLARPSQYGSGALTLLITPFPAAETPSYTSHSLSSPAPPPMAPLPLGDLDGNIPCPGRTYAPPDVAVLLDPLALAFAALIAAVGDGDDDEKEEPVAPAPAPVAGPFSVGVPSKVVEAAAVDKDDGAGRKKGSRSAGLDTASPAPPAEASSQKTLPPLPPPPLPLPLRYPARSPLALPLLIALLLLLLLPVPPSLPPPPAIAAAGALPALDRFECGTLGIRSPPLTAVASDSLWPSDAVSVGGGVGIAVVAVVVPARVAPVSVAVVVGVGSS